MTLAKAFLPSGSVLSRALLVLGGVVLIALAARVSVPMYPVPMSLQTLAISIIGLSFGARLGAVTLLAYLAAGAAGLPVFAGGGAGLKALTGPTAGFLWGFVLMAWLTGRMVEGRYTGRFRRFFIAAVVPAALLFVPGVIGLMAVTGMGFEKAMMVGVTPFIPGFLVKAATAALVVTGGWSLAARRTV